MNLISNSKGDIMSSRPKKSIEESIEKETSMKSLFPGYYNPTQDNFDALWKQGIVVLDTNVLLSLYRTPVLARNEILGILETIKNKIWIPYHVALEFQRNRPHVIEDNIKRTTETFEKSKTAINTAIDTIKSLDIEKHSNNLSSEEILSALENSLALTLKIEEELSTQQSGLSIEDELRIKIDKLIGSKIGNPPKDQKELDDLVKDADDRYALHIPPGFKDTSKSTDEFFSNGIKYKRMHGDLIIWRQIISHCKQNSVKNITIITNDRKDDWWWIEKGKTLGPHHELCSEIRAQGGVENFWMYKLESFIKIAGEKLGNSISEDTITEIKEVNSNLIKEQEARSASQDSYITVLQLQCNQIAHEMAILNESIAKLKEKDTHLENEEKSEESKPLVNLKKAINSSKIRECLTKLHELDQKRISFEKLLAIMKSNRAHRPDDDTD